MTIGQRISELRKSHGYSQEYVAEQLGVSRQAVSKWETDTSAPDTYNLIGLSQLFGVSVEYIAIGQKEEADGASSRETSCNPIVVTNHYKQGLGFDKIVGIVFLVFTLVYGILTITVNDRLLPVTLMLVVCTIMCFIQVKHKSIVAWWVFWIFDFLLSILGMTSSPFLIFNPQSYENGFSKNLFSGYFLWGWLVCIIIYTVIYYRKIQRIRKNLK